MNDWNIQSRAHACQACQAPFADKQPYHTLLFDEKLELRRLDVCEACWKNQFSAGGTEEKNVISRWTGIYEAPPPAPPEPIGKENAETLLRKLIELNDPKYGAVCYILAVMLERKRLLKIKEQFKRDGQRVFIYEQPKTGDVFTIADPNLQLDQLDQVQRDVAQLLEQGLNPPATDTPSEQNEPENAEPELESTEPAGESAEPETAAANEAEKNQSDEENPRPE